MDYQYAGSASYPRFEKEIGLVAGIFGGKATARLADLKAKSSEKLFGYWFGCMQDGAPGDVLFDAPDGLPETVRTWLNRPYDPRTPEETAAIWAAVKARPEIEAAAPQIWYELEQLAACGGGWEIS